VVVSTTTALQSAYCYQWRLHNETVLSARARIIDALAVEGFDLATEINVQETLWSKIGVDFRPYVILGVCNAALAHKALREDPQIGLMLPCNVVVQEQEGSVLVSAANPVALSAVVENKTLRPIMEEAGEAIKRAMTSLG
jgi:uncharacterized protein (DUF302 family)